MTAGCSTLEREAIECMRVACASELKRKRCDFPHCPGDDHCDIATYVAQEAMPELWETIQRLCREAR